ncbi:hypothetical protein [Kibdelosporangium philippinense]
MPHIRGRPRDDCHTHIPDRGSQALRPRSSFHLVPKREFRRAGMAGLPGV